MKQLEVQMNLLHPGKHGADIYSVGIEISNYKTLLKRANIQMIFSSVVSIC